MTAASECNMSTMHEMNDEISTNAVEALILSSPEPLPARRIAEVFEDLTPGRIGKAVAQLNESYADRGASYRIRELAGGFQFYILPEYTGYVEELFTRRRKMRLTRAALETLAIVAYRQPVTKAQIEHIRGVASDGVLQNLLEKGMITIRGRAQTVGKPLQYGTTDEFLKFFGLASLDDLPKMAEIEEMVAQQSADQTELTLELAADLANRKLNVADGTFDPASRRTTDNMPDDEQMSDDAETDTRDKPHIAEQARPAREVHVDFDTTDEGR
jgi:segregation and condensation protein B